MSAVDFGKLAAVVAVVVGSVVRVNKSNVIAAMARLVLDMPASSIGLLAGRLRCDRYLIATALQADDGVAEMV